MKAHWSFALLTSIVHAAQTNRPRQAPNAREQAAQGPVVYTPNTGPLPVNGINPLQQPSSARKALIDDQDYYGDGQTSRRWRRRRERGLDPTTGGREDLDTFMFKGAGNGKRLKPSKDQVMVHDPVNSNWHYFQFGGINMEASHAFGFTVKKGYVRLQITDMFIAGDRFSVQNVLGIHPEQLFETPAVDSAGPRVRVTDANAAFKDKNRFSSGEAYLGPGKYHIVIYPKSTPFGGGAGAIRFDSVDNLDNVTVDLMAATSQAALCRGFEGYVVVKQRVDAEHQAAVCQMIDAMEEVDFDASYKRDIMAIDKTMTRCLDKKQLLWVGAFNGDTKDGRFGLRLNKGQIQVEKRDPSERHWVLCRLKRQV